MKVMSNRSVVALVGLFVVGLGCVSAQDGETNYKHVSELSDSLSRSYSAGDKSKAAELAKEILALADEFKTEWYYANVVHKSHIMLGQIAADEGDLAAAKRHLHLSVAESLMPYGYEMIKRQPWEKQEVRPAWKASPQMDSFGPDMSLAAFLLGKGEKDDVLKYLDECEKFWKMGGEKLGEWREQIKAGETPNFGANMKYFFEARRSPEQ